MKALKTKICNFLDTLKLDLSLDKTLITNTRYSDTKFLGTHIRRGTGVRQYSKLTSAILLKAPIDLIVKRLTIKDFLQIRNGVTYPQIPNKLLTLPVKELILFYRTVMNGLRNFYSFADNKPSLRKVYYILKRSLIFGIQRKEQIGRADVLQRYGKNVTITIYRKDGTKVKLDFRCPPIARNNQFLGG